MYSKIIERAARLDRGTVSLGENKNERLLILKNFVFYCALWIIHRDFSNNLNRKHTVPTLMRVGTEVNWRSWDFLKLLFWSFHVGLSMYTVITQEHSGASFSASSITGSAENSNFVNWCLILKMIHSQTKPKKLFTMAMEIL